ncbi:ABC transporter ATP-binding protein [Saxibacter everestensis]|uniref:ABC transporter ATP-binding protein n=1 Tax=Saxibacter everestensis TaxID=2909229 RepID=A0ABY8QXY0_9MICO|nr:ABC transporter ATP-binding protein [Brevibacteriaceae bacterium ZFBP1038]
MSDNNSASDCGSMSDNNGANGLAARAEAVSAAAEQTRSATEARALAGVEPIPGVAKPDPILIVDNVSRYFGGLRAISVDHLEVQRGAITALIGPNGAGKTTFFNVLTGFDSADSGSWRFEGVPLQSLPAYKVARLGLVRTFQLTKALMRLTALENLMLGATGQRGERFFPALLKPLWSGQERKIAERADRLLNGFSLTRMRDEFAGTLSGGQRKLLEMARALMVEPTMVMLDEPMAGVNPALTQSLLGHVRELRDNGMTIVLVEHDMDVVMGISDWIVCFADGELIAEGRPDDIRANPAVIDAYLGTSRTTENSSEPNDHEDKK